MKDWQRIEAVLFGSGRYLTEEQIVQLSGVSKKSLKHALDELRKYYTHADSSLDVFKENDSWKLNVKEEYSHIVKNVISEAEMSKPVMETLALIAYKSPVFQSEIIDMRGAGAYEYISLLEEKGFITKEKFGRTFKIKITPKFYDYFDVSGDANLRKMFKNVKKPDALGSLEVYSSENKTEEQKKDEDFSTNLLERMKKVETNPDDHEEKKKFLDNFDNKFAKAKTDIDETDKEMNEFRKVAPPQPENAENKDAADGEEKKTSTDAGDKEKEAPADRTKAIWGEPDKEENESEDREEEAEGEKLDESDANYSDKVLKNFEKVLDKLDSSAAEKVEDEKEEHEEEEKEETEKAEEMEEKAQPVEEKKPAQVKKPIPEKIQEKKLTPEKIEKIKEKVLESPTPVLKETAKPGKKEEAKEKNEEKKNNKEVKVKKDEKILPKKASESSSKSKNKPEVKKPEVKKSKSKK